MISNILFYYSRYVLYLFILTYCCVINMAENKCQYVSTSLFYILLLRAGFTIKSKRNYLFKLTFVFVTQLQITNYIHVFTILVTLLILDLKTEFNFNFKHICSTNVFLFYLSCTCRFIIYQLLSAHPFTLVFRGHNLGRSENREKVVLEFRTNPGMGWF